MRRAGFPAIAIVSALIAGAALAPNAEAIPRKFWGVQAVGGTATSEDFAKMRKGGLGTFRLLLRWRSIEPNAPKEPGPLDPGGHTYDFSATDAIVANAVTNGLSLEAILTDVPSWINSDKREPPLRNKEQRDAWRDFVTVVVDRYGRNGTFWDMRPGLPERPIKDWQIFNEPNSSARYVPKVDPSGYARLVQISNDAIKAVDPRARTVLAGMFGTPGVDGSMTSADFLRELYKTANFSNRYDVIALHPYSPNLRGIRYQFDLILGALDDVGDSKPIYITEIGWSSERRKGNEGFLLKGRKGQAKMVRKAIKLIEKRRRDWNLQRVMWTFWRDPASPPPGCTFCKKAGFVDKNLKAKPAFRSLKRMIRKR